MRLIKTSIPDVIILSPTVFGDQRGFLLEMYNARTFTEFGITDSFVQDNHSSSCQGTLRGLHYQVDAPQGKLIKVFRGEIFDVAVDLRRNSVTFGNWVGVRLSADNKQQLWVPPGFAHGFYVISEWADVLYKMTDYYAPKYQRTILWNDPSIGINWPILPGVDLILSENDHDGVKFKDAEYYNW